MLADRALVADSFFLRLRGLLFRDRISPGEGLYLEPCRSIHMFGMTYAIDAVFLDAQGVVVALLENLGPGKISGIYPRAIGCLELPTGTISNTGTVLGDKLEIGDV